MNRGIVWCPHCGKPHQLGTKICPLTAKSLERTMHRSSPEIEVHPLVGTTIAGKYKLLRVVGSGGMGEVFEAENLVLKRAVAVKIVRARASTPDTIARLQREALIVAAIQHPNICDVYDVGTLPDGSPFIVLERLFGETLAVYHTRPNAPSLGAALDIFTQLLSGLQAAHGQKIVHRDLKPQNVFLVDRIGCPPLVKVVDFGLAKDLRVVRRSAITKPGNAVGTPRYMAPEQLRGEEMDPRTDVFAVGILLFETMTRVHPFAAQNVVELQVNILRNDPPSFSRLRPDLPKALEDVVRRALAKDPNARFSSAISLQHALARVAA